MSSVTFVMLCAANYKGCQVHSPVIHLLNTPFYQTVVINFYKVVIHPAAFSGSSYTFL